MTFDGTANPAPALKYAVEGAIARYKKWKDEYQERFHPLIFFFADGNPYPAENLVEYEKVAELVRKYEAEKKILVVSTGFEDANIENISKLTNYKERVLKPKNNNAEWVAEFWGEIIPKTTMAAIDICGMKQIESNVILKKMTTKTNAST